MEQSLYVFIAAMASALAWPLVGTLAIFWVWRTDGLTKLLKINDAADKIKKTTSDFLESQDKLQTSVQSLGDFAEAIKFISDKIDDINKKIFEIEPELRAIRDKVDIPPVSTMPDDFSHSASERQHIPKTTVPTSADKQKWYNEIDTAWKGVENSLKNKFGAIDKRSTGDQVYALTHGNRKIRINSDLADNIADLHSSIKSYRRRKSTLDGWLVQSVRDSFIARVRTVEKELLGTGVQI